MNKFLSFGFALAAAPACCLAQSSAIHTGLLSTLAHDLSVEYVRRAGPALPVDSLGLPRTGGVLALLAPSPPRLSLAQSIDAFERAERFGVPYSTFTSKSYSVALHRGEGEFSLTARRLNLGAGMTERDVELSYTKPVDRNARVAGAIMLRAYPFHDAQAPRELLLGLRYTRRF
jgi:hypothetical protein